MVAIKYYSDQLVMMSIFFLLLMCRKMIDFVTIASRTE